MAKLLKLRRGTDTQHSTFTGAEGEVTVNTTNDSLHVHDGTTAGGTELAKADLSNVDGSLSTNLGFGDNVKATFGASNDLEIYHDGTRSIIEERGTGNLQIRSNQTVITNQAANETQAVFNQDGQVQLFHDGAQKFNTLSTGINVTGRVTCDGLTVDGTALVQSTVGQIELKDTNNTSPDSECLIRGKDSGNSNLWYYGTGSGNEDVYVWNYRPGSMQFATNNTLRAQFTSAGHFVPGADATYDLGSVGAEWNNAYFSGSVTCDGLVVDGTFKQSNGTGALVIQDSNNTGNGVVAYVQGIDSAAAQKWFVGYGSSTNQDLFVSNSAGGQIQFQSSGTTRFTMQAAGHLVPETNNAQDLGTSSNRWRNIYTNDLNLSNEGGSNDVDGTWGSWTIQEGEDDLFLLNRRNGKKYKFNLSEVN